MRVHDEIFNFYAIILISFNVALGWMENLGQN